MEPDMKQYEKAANTLLVMVGVMMLLVGSLATWGWLG